MFAAGGQPEVAVDQHIQAVTFTRLIITHVKFQRSEAVHVMTLAQHYAPADIHRQGYVLTAIPPWPVVSVVCIGGPHSVMSRL